MAITVNETATVTVHGNVTGDKASFINQGDGWLAISVSHIGTDPRDDPGGSVAIRIPIAELPELMRQLARACHLSCRVNAIDEDS